MPGILRLGDLIPPLIFQRLAGSVGQPNPAGIGAAQRVDGDSYDNPVLSEVEGALAETINGLYKAEVIHRRGPWRSFEAVEYATLEWVDWFNHRRLLEPIGKIPPAEAEERYYATIEQSAMVA